MTTIPVLELAHRLARLPDAEFTPERVMATLQSARVDPGSLAPYCHFEAARYTRHLVYRCERFELLALCWEPGQKSSVHNHAGQQCWMLVPIGRLVNQNYRVADDDPARRICRLEPTWECPIDADHPFQVDLAEPVHRVENRLEFGARAVSLHLYSFPYDRCIGYNLESGRYAEMPLRYDTEFGEAARGPAASAAGPLG